jgi:hypothetical protein
MWKKAKSVPIRGRREPPLPLIQQTLPVYSLPWYELRSFLESRFPEHRFEEKIVSILLLLPLLYVAADNSF